MGNQIAIIFGSMGEPSWEFLEPIKAQNPFVIAADGGLLCAQAAGFTPNLYVGDNDSGGYVPENIPAVPLNPEKDWSDLQAAYTWAKEHGFAQIILTACSGGRQDHNLNNLYLLELAWREGILATLVDSRNKITILPPGETIFTSNGYTYFSILPLDSTLEGVTIQGAKYPLDNATIHRHQGLAISNETLGDTATITIQKGLALLMKTN